jgi:hypothetical protein
MAIKKSPWTAEDVCRIIKACSEAKVTSFQDGNLRISWEITSPSPGPRAGDSPLPVATLTEPQHDEITKAALEVEELRLRETQLEDLAIDDPAEMERRIHAGELGDVGSDDEIDDG